MACGLMHLKEHWRSFHVLEVGSELRMICIVWVLGACKVVMRVMIRVVMIIVMIIVISRVIKLNILEHLQAIRT